MVWRSRADVAQSVEHSLGKGEVVGSIPIISSRFTGRNAVRFTWLQQGFRAGVPVGVAQGCGSNSVVESQPSKLLVAGPIPVSRSSIRHIRIKTGLGAKTAAHV